jgi:hypothetical protein
VQRARPVFALHALFIQTLVLVGPARGQEAEPPRTVFEMVVPGGLGAALATVDDRAAIDRSQFVLELIRRFHNTPFRTKNDPRERVLRSLFAHLDEAGRTGELTGSPETVPLPLPPSIWTDRIFGGRTTAQNLLSAILRSRDAGLLYYGLLSLDEAARSWIAGQPDLLVDLATRGAGAFVVAAPGLRVRGTAIRVPGGESAEPVWEALVGRRTSEPVDFVRALLAQGEGRLAYFFGAMAQLSPAQVDASLNLDSPDAAERVAAGRRLYVAFRRMGQGWMIEERPLWRPTLDPALLIADLSADHRGRPLLPGDRGFWTMVFAETDSSRAGDRLSDYAGGRPVDLSWLCEQVFKSKPPEQRRRYQLVQFASRIVGRVTPETTRDAIDAIRAAGDYPALVAILERARLTDIAVFARAVRRAARLTTIEQSARAVRALAQFQGILALVTRATLRGSLRAESLPEIVVSLAAVDVSERGEYEGRLVRWLDAHLTRAAWNPAAILEDESASDKDENGSIDGDLLRMVAGPTAVEPRFVDWEGTRYRLDLTAAEATRLARLLGDRRRPYFSSARALVAIADTLEARGLTGDGLSQQGRIFDQVTHAGAWEEARDYRDVASALGRAAREGNVRAAAGLAPALRTLADDLLARGLVELTYAAALGEPDGVSVAASEAAARHDFGVQSGGVRRAAWLHPLAGADAGKGWRITGSILGLDVRLAEFSLKRLSVKPPSRKPTLNTEDRHVFVGAVALVSPMALSDGDRDTIVAAIRTGRERLDAVRTPIEAAAIADEIRLSPSRRTLLVWIVSHDRERIGSFLSPSELLWLGLEKRPLDPRLHAWGAPGEPRFGCLCLRLIDRRPWETFAGRWSSGIFASAFPDLNLRLAELLAELQMPAILLGPVLASATLDFVNTAISRDQDDRRGLVEFVQALGSERLEQYLALLTTDGPLVPVDDARVARR